MSSIDKLALTCRLLYDQRLLEQRKEIEMLKVKLFFRDYTKENLLKATKTLNHANIRCKCSGCQRAGRILCFDTEDNGATCTFGPWLDRILHERGLVVLRKDDWEEEMCDGLYEDEIGKISDGFTGVFDFSKNDCHLVEKPFTTFEIDSDPETRWADICIGKRLWNVESTNNQWIKQFERVFGASDLRLSSPPSPRAAPLSPPS